MDTIPADALHETWDSVYDKSVQLARLIEAHCKHTGERFDAIIVMPRGSYYPVNIVARELGFTAVELLHACIGSYDLGTTKRKIQFEVGQMPTDEQVADKNIIIIDEVCDSGYTLQFLVERLREQGISMVRTGVLHYKPGNSQTGFIPDWFVGQTEQWIVYPWELNELSGKSSIVKRKRTPN